MIHSRRDRDRDREGERGRETHTQRGKKEVGERETGRGGGREGWQRDRERY